MKKLALLTFFTLIFAPSAFAAEIVKIKVNGMVCDFCARAIEKVFSKQEAIQTIEVNLTDKMITAILKDGQTLDDETITSLVKDSGYVVAEITREEEKAKEAVHE